LETVGGGTGLYCGTTGTTGLGQFGIVAPFGQITLSFPPPVPVAACSASACVTPRPKTFHHSAHSFVPNVSSPVLRAAGFAPALRSISFSPPASRPALVASHAPSACMYVICACWFL